MGDRLTVFVTLCFERFSTSYLLYSGQIESLSIVLKDDAELNTIEWIGLILSARYAILSSHSIRASINQCICHATHKMCAMRIIVHEPFT